MQSVGKVLGVVQQRLALSFVIDALGAVEVLVGLEQRLALGMIVIEEQIAQRCALDRGSAGLPISIFMQVSC